MIEMWQNESRTARCTTTERPLTHSLDPREEGLAMQATRTCSVTGCDLRIYAHGWCPKHYTRWRRNGDPLALRRPAERLTCSIPDCAELPHGYTWCKKHYARWRATGDPLMVRPNVRTPPGEQHPSWQGTEILYTTAHRRVRDAKGRAAAHLCVDCGRQAAEWSYDHLDPDEVVHLDECRPHPYSTKPEHYQPRCVRCHRRFDRAARS